MMVSDGIFDEISPSTMIITSLGTFDENAKDGEIWVTVVVESVVTSSAGQRVAASEDSDVSGDSCDTLDSVD